jgi:gliding motility-associated-like protein
LENNASSYLWSIPAGASIVSGNTSNTVSIQLGDASGSITVTPQNQCGSATSPASLNINVKTVPTESVSIIGDFTPCATQTAEAYQASSVAAGVSYVWTSSIGNLNSSGANASLDFSSATATSGNLKVQLSNECGLGNSDTEPIQIVNALVPSVQLSSDKAGDKFCIGEATVTLTATATNGGNSPTYVFALNGTPLVTSNNIVSLTPTELGSGATVLVEMVSNESCLANPSNNMASSTLELKGIKGPKPTLATNIDKVCEYDQTGILITTSGLGDLPVSYQWLKDGNLIPTANSNSLQLTQVSQSGRYSVRMDDGVCSAYTSIASPFLTIMPRPLIETLPKVEADISADGKTLVYLSSKVTPASSLLNWTGEGIVSDKDKNTITLALSKEAVYSYTITATDTNCSSSQTVEVVAKLPLKIPNAFTPNGDGLNDTWTFVGLVDYAYLKVTIFNRWGSIVFKKEGEQVSPWDGSTNQGVKLETGTYYYLLEVRKYNGDRLTLDGHVTILQ